jgi:hypothetical protein
MPGTGLSIEEELRESAWEQGSLLPAPVCVPISAWAHPERQAAPTVAKQVANISRKRMLSAPEQVIARPKKPGSRLAVISQTCDLLKAPEQMPTVEVALALETDNDKLIAEASNFASARYYRLTPAGAEPAMVLDYGWREHLDKGFLLAHAPDNSLLEEWDRPRRETFARWLGRRSDRPVLSDHDVATILDPLRRAWEKFIEDEPELARRCTEHYSELRFRRVEETLWLYLISSQDAPDEILGLEAGEVVVAALGPHHADVRTDPRTYASISMAEYLASEQIDFEWASHLEGEAIGAVADLG